MAQVDVVPYVGLDVMSALLAAPTDWEGGWGTGSVAAARTATTLSTEASEDREPVTLDQGTIAQTNDTLVASFTMTADGAKNITNAGVLDASGDLVLLSSFDGIDVVGPTPGPATEVTFIFKLRLK